MECRTEPPKMGDNATSSPMPRIVNGLPFRPRERIDAWECIGFLGVCLLPGVISLLAIVPLAVRGILKYLGAKRFLPNRPDASE